jgi:hypothetical protein
MDGRTDGQTTQNNALTDARMDGLTDDLIENNSTNIIQPDTQQPHDDTTGTKRSDGKTTSGSSSGYAPRVLPRRILLHLPRKGGTTNKVLGHPPKLKVHNLPHMRERVHRRYRAQPGKTLERRQWLLQGIPKQPTHSLYAHHNQGHTSRTSVAPTDVREKPEGGILVPMHPFPD